MFIYIVYEALIDFELKNQTLVTRFKMTLDNRLPKTNRLGITFKVWLYVI